MYREAREAALRRAEALNWPPVRVWGGSRVLTGRQDWETCLSTFGRLNDADGRDIEAQLDALERGRVPS